MNPKILNGEPNKDRIKNLPEAKGKPSKPVNLGKFGSYLWDRIVPDLVASKTVAKIDETALEELCNWYETYKQLCHYQLDDIGSTTATRIATQKKNAWVECSNLMIRFGMDPAARGKLNLIEPETKDNLSEFE